MSENSERVAFEASMRARGSGDSWWHVDDDGEWVEPRIRHAFTGWQAARQQVAAPTTRRVEKDPEGGWIARRKDGSVIPDESFRWNSRSAAQGAVLDSDTFDRTAQQVAAPAVPIGYMAQLHVEMLQQGQDLFGADVMHSRFHQYNVPIYAAPPAVAPTPPEQS